MVGEMIILQLLAWWTAYKALEIPLTFFFPDSVLFYHHFLVYQWSNNYFLKYILFRNIF
jgi:hypothetical protein